MRSQLKADAMKHTTGTAASLVTLPSVVAKVLYRRAISGDPGDKSIEGFEEVTYLEEDEANNEIEKQAKEVSVASYIVYSCNQNSRTARIFLVMTQIPDHHDVGVYVPPFCALVD